MGTYIDLLPEWGDYLTDKHRIHPERFEQYMYCIAAYESEYFRRRSVDENDPGWKLSVQDELEDDDFYGTFYDRKPTPKAALAANRKHEAKLPPPAFFHQGTDNSWRNDPFNKANANEDLPGNRKFRRLHPESTARSYRDFYYESKLGWSTVLERDTTQFRRRLHVRDYLEGLHWVLNYYHNGCPSWSWYFPYLYSPLSTDMVNLREFYDEAEDDDVNGFCAFKFHQGEPFPSLAQLLSVLPPQSAALLPQPLSELMWHPSSPLVKFYPNDFTTDANGKRESWEAVVQIPFIDADILLDTVQQIIDADETAVRKGKEGLLTKSERLRNVKGKDHVFVVPRPSLLDDDVNGDNLSRTSHVSALLSQLESDSPTDESRSRGQQTKTVLSQPIEARVSRSRRTMSSESNRTDVDPKV